MNVVLRGLGLGLLVLLGGCLEVESLEMTVVADQAQDRLDVMIVSRGVWSSATTDGNAAKDLADLRKCRDVAALIIPGLGVADFTSEPDEGEDWQRSIEFVAIEPGAFFVDEQGRLSFYQFFRIERVREFVEGGAVIARKAWAKEREKASPASQACIDAAVRDGLAPVAIDGAGFLFRRPIALADHQAEQIALWRTIVRNVETALSEEGGGSSAATQRGLVQMIRDNDVAVVRHEGYTEYVIGVQGSASCEYQFRGEPYQDNLLQALSKEEPRPPAASQALVDRQFAAFCKRDVRMPKPYAEARRKVLEQREQNKR